MEFENEVGVTLSPGARVVVASPLLPLSGAVVIGFVVGVVVTKLAQRRRGNTAAARFGAGGAAAPPLRMPAGNPDVETEL